MMEKEQKKNQVTIIKHKHGKNFNLCIGYIYKQK